MRNLTRSTPVEHRVLTLILVTFVAVAGLYSAGVPLFEAPDETAHVDYVRFLRAEKRLPRQEQSGEAHQPPLYYLLAAVASLPASLEDLGQVQRSNPNWIWAGVGQDVNAIYHTAAELFPWRGAVFAIHLMRIASVLMGAATVLIVYRIGRELSPGRPLLPLGAAALVACTPQFVFISGTVNNDNLANLCAAIATWMLVRLLVGRRDRWTLIGLGLALGAGLMAKQSILPLVPLAAVILVYRSLREQNYRLLLEGGLIVGGGIVLTSGWWYWRNQALYGDLFGVNTFLAHRPQESSATITDWETLRIFLQKMHRSFWGVFGWGNVPLPTWFYRASAAVYILAAIGGGVALSRSRRQVARPRVVWALLAVLPVLYVLWVVAYSHRFGGSGWQGRYLFPALPAVALLLTAGLMNLLPGRTQPAALVLTGLGLLAITVWALPEVIGPAYLRVTQPPSVLERIQQPMDANFADLIRLAGHDLAVTLESGEPKVEITLYWQATGQPPTDYKVFVHLVNLNWDLYGQGDRFPLDGQFPTSAWRPGDLIVDPHPVELQQPVTAGEYRIGVGWYLESTGERLSIVREGQETGTVAETSVFRLPP